MSNLTLRSAILEDLPILYEFEQGVIKAERPFAPTLKPDPINYYDIKTLIQSDDSELVVVQIEEELVGCGYARIEKSNPHWQHDFYAYLGFMYVKPEHRGKGIVRKVIDALIDWSKNKGVTEIQLEVYSDNQPAVKAYERAGFTRDTMRMRMEVQD